METFKKIEKRQILEKTLVLLKHIKNKCAMRK